MVPRIARSLAVILLVAALIGVMVPLRFEVSAQTTLYPILETDLESDPAWEHGGTYDEWQWGAPSSGPGNAHSGKYCYATNLSGDYSVGSNQWLRSPTVDLTKANKAELSFWHYYDISWLLLLYDEAYLELSTDGGWSWQNLSSYTGMIENGAWAEEVIDISMYTGSKVIVQWRLTSDSFISISGDGWNIDDIEVRADIEPGTTDLATVELYTEPAKPSVNGDTNIFLTIMNKGTNEVASFPFKIEVEKVDDPSGKQEWKDTYSLEPGSTVTYKARWNPTEKGTYRIKAGLQKNSWSDEVPENDRMEITVVVDDSTQPPPPPPPPPPPQKPDLSFVSLTVTGPSPSQTIIYVNDKVSIMWGVLNTGPLEVPSWALDYFISDTSTGEVVAKGSEATGPLKAGDTSTGTTGQIFTKAGTYKIVYTATLVGDANPGDNSATRYVTIFDRGNRHDTGIERVEVSPRSAPVGYVAGQWTNYTVKNIGDYDESPVIRFQVTAPNGTVMSYFTNSYSLAPGQRGYYNTTFKAQEEGTYKACATILDPPKDDDPSNDELCTEFYVVDTRLHDVAVSKLTAKGLTDKQNRNVSFQVWDLGEVSETFWAELMVYNETGGHVDTKTFDSGSLAPGGNVTMLWPNLTLPYEGRFRILAQVHWDPKGVHSSQIDDRPDNDMAELWTTYIASPIEQFDFGITMVYAEPVVAKPGGLVQVGIEVTNLGWASPGGGSVPLFCNITTPSSGIEYLNQTVYFAGPFPQIFLFNVSYSIIGTYRVDALFDIADNVDVDDRGNTTFWVDVDRQNMTDLVVDDLMVEPRFGGDEQQRQLTARIRNAGTALTSFDAICNVTLAGVVKQNMVSRISLLPGESAEVQKEWTPTPSEYGDFDVNISLYPDAQFIEMFWPDNSMNVTNTVTRPSSARDHDIAITALFTEPPSPYAGGDVSAYVTLVNLGTEDEPFEVSMTVTGPQDPGQVAPVTDILGIGGEDTVVLRFTPPVAGDYTLTVNAKTTSATDEVPANNVMTVTISVAAQAVLDYDLTVTGIINYPASNIHVDDGVTSTAYIYNVGTTGNFVGTVDVTITVDCGSSYHNDGSWAMTMNGDGPLTVSLQWAPLQQGVCIIVATVDYPGDTDQGNDLYSISVNVLPKDDGGGGGGGGGGGVLPPQSAGGPEPTYSLVPFLYLFLIAIVMMAVGLARHQMVRRSHQKAGRVPPDELTDMDLYDMGYDVVPLATALASGGTAASVQASPQRSPPQYRPRYAPQPRQDPQYRSTPDQRSRSRQRSSQGSPVQQQRTSQQPQYPPVTTMAGRRGPARPGTRAMPPRRR